MLGVGLGFGMIFSHIGPGIHPRPQASTPAGRNQARATLIQQLAAAMQRYHTDHGNFPIGLTATDTQICTSAGPNCLSKGLADLSFLTTGGDYIPGIPQDPLGGKGLWGSGFTIAALPDGTLRIQAPKAELGKKIQVISQL